MKYRTIVADPPWPVKHTGGKVKAGASSGSTRVYEKRPLPYKTMPVNEIAALPVADLAEEDAHLFMWVTDEFLLDGSARVVAEAWGFRLIPPLVVWHKPSAGLGRIFRPAHEVMVIGRRGEGRLEEISVRTVHEWMQVYENGAKKHSAKPDGAMDLVERLSPGPRLEMFARRNRLGWDTWGNEALEHVDLGGGLIHQPTHREISVSVATQSEAERLRGALELVGGYLGILGAAPLAQKMIREALAGASPATPGGST